MTRWNSCWVLTGIFLMFLSACAPSKRPMPLTAEMAGVSEKFSAGEIIDLKAGKAISFDCLLDQLESVPLVFVGENHDNPEHHLIQVQILQGLMDRNHVRAVAMEFFPRTAQGIIDEYMKGEMDETAFLEKIDWDKIWGFPYLFYRPLIFQIREKNGVLSGLECPA